jgi:hypothetical protein
VTRLVESEMAAEVVGSVSSRGDVTCKVADEIVRRRGGTIGDDNDGRVDLVEASDAVGITSSY